MQIYDLEPISRLKVLDFLRGMPSYIVNRVDVRTCIGRGRRGKLDLSDELSDYEDYEDNTVDICYVLLKFILQEIPFNQQKVIEVCGPIL